MNDLIVIQPKQIGNEEINSVDARDLHSRLGLKKDFTNWIKDNIKKLNLVENVDYVVYAQKGENLSGGRPSSEYILTLDAGKHIAMMTNTDTAKSIRTYFIEFEKSAKQAVTLPQDPIIMLRMEQLNMHEKINVVGIGLAETRNDVDHIKRNMKLENWQQISIQKAVNHKVEVWREMYPSLNTRKAYPAIYRHLKDKFSVPRYNEIPAIDYDFALSTVTKLNMSGLAGL